MQLLAPLVPDPAAPLARANPVAKLGAAAILMLGLFLALDLPTAALVVAVELAVVPASGLRPGTLARRSVPLLAAALGIGLLNALLPADPTGETLLRLGPLHLTSGSLLTGVALVVRLVGIAFAGVLAVATTDPTELADALVGQLRVSPRFAIGALAAFRLLPILGQEWETIRLARRARGIEAGRSPLAAARLFAGQMLALLVGAIRRGTRMAMAMEARGFGTRECRTVARPQRMRSADWWLLGAALAVAVGATLVSLAAGSYRFLLG